MSAVAELAPTRKLIHRWARQGDLYIATVGDRVYARADQVERLAEISPWSGGETLFGDTWPLVLEGFPYYDLDDAIARCESAGTPRAAAFLEWLTDTLAPMLTDEVLDLAQRVPSFIGSHPVNIAARLLSEDPAVQIGRAGLFAHMHQLGWILRTVGKAAQHSDWHIAQAARRAGWLTVRDVTIPATNREHRRTYSQIHVTPAGLTELARTLHALHPDRDTAAPPHPQLFD
ncbi:phage antirepressor KilAC domain-containing protein [Microbacterium allomyrinae]|uniref:Phage antirepressor KilAC domain-containing protein n=1 Tax=Microbacterium allomyrinae TaxID=2830666 RepID=A0A9X1LU60_9MICO|nr:phage antirepressor KilAC domain-containing protein [Microbacterium allomyrinae]MCC2031803.1 phage antirepressor KilAC domain-containing protein [Microbacterium allomyrinae]